MRVIVQNSPEHNLNQGVINLHADANIARQWSDFQEFSEADSAYFERLLPLEGFEPGRVESIREFSPELPPKEMLEVAAQTEVHLEEIQLLPGDEAAAVRLLLKRGKISAAPASEILQPIPIPATKVAQRQAMRARLDAAIMAEAARILTERKVDPNGRELDQKAFTKTNLIVVKSAIDKTVNASIGKQSGKRHEVTRLELDQIELIGPENVRHEDLLVDGLLV